MIRILEPNQIVPYPTKYIAFLRIFSFVNINIVQIFSLGCIHGWDFHASFGFAVSLPAGIAAMLAILAGAYNVVTRRGAQERMKVWRKAFGLFLLFLWW